MLSSKPASASAAATTPFKGESFPSYVLSRRSSRVGRGFRAHRDDALHTECDSHPLASTTTSSPTSAPIRAEAVSVVVSPATAAPCRTPQRSSVSPLRSSVSTPTRRSVQQRPSLSEQLRSISQGAQDITAQLRAAHGLQPASLASSSACSGLQATTTSMVVGKLECRFPCPVVFLPDHCAYVFQHPFAAKEIEMVMFYRDMVGVRVSLRERSVRFRILRALEHFGDDYNPANPQHAITIVLATAADALSVKRFVAAHRLWFPPV